MAGSMNIFPQWRKPTRYESVTAKRYEWVTATAEQHVSNQNGGIYYSALFTGWTRDGWEIVSITPVRHATSWLGFLLVGVLRREIRS